MAVWTTADGTANASDDDGPLATRAMMARKVRRRAGIVIADSSNSLAYYCYKPLYILARAKMLVPPATLDYM